MGKVAEEQDAMEQAQIPGTPENEAAIEAILDEAGVEAGTPEAEVAILSSTIEGTPESEVAVQAALDAAATDN